MVVPVLDVEREDLVDALRVEEEELGLVPVRRGASCSGDQLAR